MTKSAHTNIRFANILDAHAIAVIHVISWQTIYRGQIPDTVLDALSVKEWEQNWCDLLNKNVKVLVIEHNYQMVGFASICPSRDSDTDPTKCGEISSIYLHPDIWHQGLGSKLCSAALSELEKEGFAEVIAWVLEKNISARKFYEKIGFINTGDIKKESFIKQVILNEVRYLKKLMHV